MGVLYFIAALFTCAMQVQANDFQPLMTQGLHGRTLVENNEYVGYVSESFMGTMSSLEDIIYQACESATQTEHQRQLFQGEHIFSLSSVAYRTYFSFTCPADGVLRQIPDGLVVEKNGLMFADVAPESWGLDRIDQPVLPLSESAFDSFYTGKGVKVYVIDTGINKDHVDFSGRASFGADFVNEASKYDMHGHGTHCSGTATASTYGIAKEANVISVKVLNQYGSGSFTSVLNGINWAVQDAGATPSVLSISLGGGYSCTLDDAVKAASAAGHIVAVAAGNSGADACLASPAASGGNAVSGGPVTVMASDVNDNLASYSNWGTCTDIVAPGSHITSTWIGSNTATNTISGTSMATPHVAGVAALLLQKHNFNKKNAQDELLSLRVWNQIKGSFYGGPNALLQIPTYTGAPTAPTPRPTPPPTPEVAELCAGDICTVEVGLSLFGPSWPEDFLSARGVVAQTDLCAPVAAGTYDGKIVLVDRGTCFFYDKVFNAESAGAIAVVIVNSLGSPLIDPNYQYEDNVDIPSLMIQYEQGRKMEPMWNSVLVGYGYQDSGNTSPPTTYTPTTESPTLAPTATPTASPTKSPTSAPTRVPTSAPTDPRTPEQIEWDFCSKYGGRQGCQRVDCRCTWNAEKIEGKWQPINQNYKAKSCLPNFIFN